MEEREDRVRYLSLEYTCVCLSILYGGVRVIRGTNQRCKHFTYLCNVAVSGGNWLDATICNWIASDKMRSRAHECSRSCHTIQQLDLHPVYLLLVDVIARSGEPHSGRRYTPENNIGRK